MSGGADIRVLHVDDDPEFCALTARHLERTDEDIAVTAETSASDGLVHLEAGAVDCVVSDQEMPEMEGLEFLRAVRAVDADLPFILFTGKGSESIAAEAIRQGVTDYLRKRPGTDQYTLLANRIRRAVETRRTKTKLAETERMFSTLVANLPGMVYRCLNERGWPMTFVSEGARELTGYAPSAIEAGEVSVGEDLIHPEDRAAVRERVESAVDAGEPFRLTYRIRTADDEVRWVWEQGRPIDRGEDGVAVIEGFVTDITARKSRAQELDAESQLPGRSSTLWTTSST